MRGAGLPWDPGVAFRNGPYSSGTARGENGGAIEKWNWFLLISKKKKKKKKKEGKTTRNILVKNVRYENAQRTRTMTKGGRGYFQ